MKTKRECEWESGWRWWGGKRRIWWVSGVLVITCIWMPVHIIFAKNYFYLKSHLKPLIFQTFDALCLEQDLLSDIDRRTRLTVAGIAALEINRKLWVHDFRFLFFQYSAIDHRNFLTDFYFRWVVIREKSKNIHFRQSRKRTADSSEEGKDESKRLRLE